MGQVRYIIQNTRHVCVCRDYKLYYFTLHAKGQIKNRISQSQRSATILYDAYTNLRVLNVACVDFECEFHNGYVKGETEQNSVTLYDGN